MRSLENSKGSQLPIFFDKANNVYVYRFDYPEIEVLKLSPTFKTVMDFRSGVSLDESSNTWTNFESAYTYGGNRIIHSFKDGQFWDLGLRSDVSFTAVFGNLVLLVDYGGRFTSYLLGPGATVSERLSHEETMKVVAARSLELDLSIESGVVLYRGLPWYSYGQKKKWGKVFGLPLAIDKDGNSYSPGSVVDAMGNVVQEMNLFKSTGEPIYSQIVFDYEGNVYPIKWTLIYYIGRDWGYPDAKKGTVTLDGAALKLHPGASELTISTAKSGPVTVFEKTLQKELISGKSAAWYKVKLATGLVGWIHGGALTVPEDATLKTFDSPVLGKK